MKVLVLFFLGLFLLHEVQAQRENVWVTGRVGVDFNQNPPVSFLTSKVVFNEGSATVCDRAGKLLFYTDGTSVYDRNYQLMPSGENLNGTPLTYATGSTTQGALIMPVPEKSNQYYIFSMTSWEMGENFGRLYYSIADMTLNGGLGDILPGQKGVLLDSNFTEKMTAIPGDRCNLWLIVRSRKAAVFKSFEITAAGINREAVVSKAGLYEAAVYRIGEIVPSHDGKRLVVANIDNESGLEILDFNAGTGQLSNAVQLDTGKYYSACFSPDNRKLYVSPYQATGARPGLYQYDLMAVNPGQSKVNIDSSGGFSKLKLAPDGKIYYLDTAYSFGAIRNPNASAASIGLTRRAIVFPDFVTGSAIPNTVIELKKDTAASAPHLITAACWQTEVTLYGEPDAWGFVWEDGSTYRIRKVNASGRYALGYYTPPCVYHQDTFSVDFANGFLPQIFTANSCSGTANGKAWATTYDGDTVTYQYSWADAAGQPLSFKDTVDHLPAGQYIVKIHTFNCDTLLAFTIKEERSRVSFITDSISCQNTVLPIRNTSDVHYTDFYWNFGDGNTATSRDAAHSYLKPGAYILALAGRGAVCEDTAYATVIVDAPATNFSFLTDQDNVCSGQQLLLRPTSDSTLVHLYWNFGPGDDVVTGGGELQRSFDHPGDYVLGLTGIFRRCPEISYERSLIVYPLPAVDLGPDKPLCLNGDVLHIENRTPSIEGDQFLWSNDATSEGITVRHPGVYTLTVTNKGGCKATENITISKDCYIDIPNAFSPDNDGINDYFFPRQLLSRKISGFHLQIFNRWGRLIFETRNASGRGWDGRFNNQEQPAGVYIYHIEMEFDGTSAEQYQGNVMLIR